MFFWVHRGSRLRYDGSRNNVTYQDHHHHHFSLVISGCRWVANKNTRRLLLLSVPSGVRMSYPSYLRINSTCTMAWHCIVYSYEYTAVSLLVYTLYQVCMYLSVIPCICRIFVLRPHRACISINRMKNQHGYN